MVWVRRFHRGLCSVLMVCMVFLFGGTSGYAQEKEAAPRITREELRHEIMRFSGSSSDRISEAYFKLEERFRTSKARHAALENGLVYSASALDIAIAPNPEVNLLDMVVLVALSRIVVEEYWVPQVFGDEAKILVEVFRREEADIWSIAGKVLTPQQQQELRSSIQAWRKGNPDQVFVEATRFGDFAEIHGKSALAAAAKSGGFLGVTEVTREVSEARLLAERVMFYAQRMPFLVRSQARLLLVEAGMAPEVQQLVSNSTTFAGTAKEFVQFAKELPKYVSEERKATIDQLMSQEKPVRGLLADVRQTLTAGTALAVQLDATVGTVDSLFARLQARKKEPTDIKDVQKVLQQSTVLIKSIDEILTSPGWDQRFPQLVQVVDRIEGEGEEWVDHAFRRAVALIVIFFLAMLGYRYASVRLIGSGQARGT